MTVAYACDSMYMCEFRDEILLRVEECENLGNVKREVTITVQTVSLEISLDLI